MTLDNSREELTVHLERALLVSVALPDRPWLGNDPLEELRGLATTAGAVVVGNLLQKRQTVIPGTYIGKGKVEELKEQVEATEADVVIFDNDLSPAQVRNLEKATTVKVLDRSELILDIFATRARSVEARLQVELAQLEYSLPRLRKMWTHLSRYEGGIGMRGPGETQLEEDRRLVDTRIRDLKQRLAEVHARRAARGAKPARRTHGLSRGLHQRGQKHTHERPHRRRVLAEDKLFSTLETRTRQWRLSDWGRVLLSDTVGFIRELPHHLIASFKATLEETRQARLLLHVVDASNPQAEEQVKAVNKVLAELGCKDKPTLLVLNKIDRVTDWTLVNVLMSQHRHCIAVSAATGSGLEQLRDAVIEALSADFAEVEVEMDAAHGRVHAYLAAHAEIIQQSYQDNRVLLALPVTETTRLPHPRARSTHSRGG